MTRELTEVVISPEKHQYCHRDVKNIMSFWLFFKEREQTVIATQIIVIADNKG